MRHWRGTDTDLGGRGISGEMSSELHVEVERRLTRHRRPPGRRDSDTKE